MRHYLDILTDTFMIRQLHPWHSNGKKRLIKSPKIFVRDSGIVHALMSIPDEKALRIHPKIGASWEGFAIEQTVRHFKLESTESFFWGVHGGAELDLIFFKNGKAWGAEIKYTDAPKLTPSMLSALNELNLAHLWVLYPGSKSYALHEKVLTVPLSQLTTIRL
jgi:predicted AAA+ superfamily ATPase